MLKADVSPDGQRVILEAEFHHEDRIKKLIGATFDKVTERWSVPLTWSACVSLRNDFGAQFAPSEALNAWGYEELQQRVAPARDLRHSLSLTDCLDHVGDGMGRYGEIVRAAEEMGEELNLYPYQRAGAAFAAVTRSCLVLDEQGTGKTAQTITALRLLQHHDDSPFPALIVAPSSVKRVWYRHFTEWYPGLTVVDVKGTAVQRRKQLSEPAHVYIVSYGSMPKHSRLAKSPGAPALRRCEECGGMDPTITEDKCQAHMRELNKIPFRTVITDEAHRMLDTKSTWSRAIWSVSDSATYRYALTGTPVQDNMANFWALLRFVNPDEFTGKTQFLDRYALGGFTAWGSYQIDGINPARADEFQAITQPYFRRVLKEVALPFLPPIQEERRFVDMTGAQAKAYRDMKKKMYAELSGKVLTSLRPITQAGRLMQLASSYLEVLDPDSDLELGSEDEVPPPDVRLALPSNKVSAFMADVKSGDFDQNSKGVIVFAQSRQLLELLSEELKRADLPHGMVTGALTEDQRNDAIDRFQAGEIKYILVSISAGGAGLTLTAADTMVFLQRSWSSTAMTQAEARAHRLGSEVHDSIRLIHYLSEGTIEEHQLNTLAKKGIRIEEILQDAAALLAWMEEAEAAV